MLSLELMGLLGLGIIWINTLLVILDIFKERKRWRLLSRLPQRVRKTTDEDAVFVSYFEGPKTLGTLSIDLSGRLLDTKDPTVRFHDRSHAQEIHGGELLINGAHLIVPPKEEGEVWISDRQLHNRLNELAARAPEEVTQQAKKAKGYRTTLNGNIEPGTTVWAVGRVNAQGQLQACITKKLPLILSTVDPTRLARRNLQWITLFALGCLGLAGATTALSLWPPLFGMMSTVGGALGLLYFLLVQPALRTLKLAVQDPGSKMLEHVWTAPAPELAKAPRRTPSVVH